MSQPDDEWGSYIFFTGFLPFFRRLFLAESLLSEAF